MSMRKALKPKASKALFTRTAMKRHSKNDLASKAGSSVVMRGGIRL